LTGSSRDSVARKGAVDPVRTLNHERLGRGRGFRRRSPRCESAGKPFCFLCALTTRL
jgi:hypothetical protein